MKARVHVRERLAEGSRRGLGCAAVVASDAVHDAGLLRELVEALGDERAVVVARAANALKKVQKASARALDGFAGELIQGAASCAVLEARWNLLLVAARLRLTARQRAAVADVLLEAMASASAFERVHAMQALVDVSAGDARLRSRVHEVVERAREDVSAAVRARARKLMQA